MRCAVVDLATNEVVNVIVAQPDDLPPDGCILVEIPDDSPVSIGWVYVDGVFIAPTTPDDTLTGADGNDTVT